MKKLLATLFMLAFIGFIGGCTFSEDYYLSEDNAINIAEGAIDGHAVYWRVGAQTGTVLVCAGPVLYYILMTTSNEVEILALEEVDQSSVKCLKDEGE